VCGSIPTVVLVCEDGVVEESDAGRPEVLALDGIEVILPRHHAVLCRGELYKHYFR
jgi:hypothetical protein